MNNSIASRLQVRFADNTQPPTHFNCVASSLAVAVLSLYSTVRLCSLVCLIILFRTGKMRETAKMKTE